MVQMNRITVSFSPETYRQLEAIALENRLSLSWVVRYAVESLVKNNPGGQQMILPLQKRVNNEHQAD